MKNIELKMETTKLNIAKNEFAPIKRGYIKDYRRTTINQMQELDSYLKTKQMILAISGLKEIKDISPFFG